MEKNSYYKEWAQNNPFWDSAWYCYWKYHTDPTFREEKKQYYKDHREEKLEKYKQYYKDHREEIKQYHKQYYKDHREEILEQKKEYYERMKNGK